MAKFLNACGVPSVPLFILDQSVNIIMIIMSVKSFSVSCSSESPFAYVLLFYSGTSLEIGCKAWHVSS